MKTIGITIIAALFALPLWGDDALPEKENFHLYLLVGQSNMAGRGKSQNRTSSKIPESLLSQKI